jgi:hypothetical protein
MKRLAFALLLVMAGTARAHVSSVTYAALSVDGDQVTYELKISSRDLYEALKLEKDRVATQAEVEAGTQLLEDYVLARVKVSRRGAPCTAHPRGIGSEDSGDGFYAVVTVEYACPKPVDVVEMRYDLFFDVDKRHESQTRVSWRAGDESVPRSQDVWFKDAARDFRWDRANVVDVRHEPGAATQAWRAALGVVETPAELLLVLALIAAFAAGPAPFRRALPVLAAFAVGHAVGVTAAGRAWIVLAPRLVAVAAAATVVYVALENLVTGATGARWLVALGFGAVHGAGFGRAGALAQTAAATCQLAVGCAALALGIWLARTAKRFPAWASGALCLGGAALVALRAFSS